MAETILFSQYIGNAGETDSMYISLSSDIDVSLSGITPIRIEMSEVFNSASPMMSFEFTDANGDLVNHIKIPPNAVFYFDIGYSPLNATRVELRCSKTVLLNQRPGSSEQIAFKMFFVLSNWHEFVSKKKNRAWKDTSHADIARDLLASFSSVEISQTSTKPEFFVQPYWSDFDALRYIRNKSFTSNGGHMEFGAKLNGTFLFKSTGDMIAEQKEQAVSGNIPVFRLEGQISDTEIRKQAYERNEAPTYFMHYTAEEEYLGAVGEGAGGVSAMFFDTVTDRYVKTDLTYSDTASPQMSDWASVMQADEGTSVRVYGGRYSDVIEESSNMLVDLVDSVNRFEITTERALGIHIGRMVEVIIPTPPNAGSIVPQNIFYSGFYLVCGVHHVVNFSRSTVTSTISLMREGRDGKQLEGYSRSIVGKFL